MKHAVYGIVQDQSTAERVVDGLRSAGFTGNDISVLFPDKGGTKDFAHDKNTKAPEGATTGGVAGMGIGAALGWLAGIGSLAIPGVGPFIAAGPIMAALGSRGRRRDRGPGRCSSWPRDSRIRSETL